MKSADRLQQNMGSLLIGRRSFGVFEITPGVLGSMLWLDSKHGKRGFFATRNFRWGEMTIKLLLKSGCLETAGSQVIVAWPFLQVGILTFGYMPFSSVQPVLTRWNPAARDPSWNNRGKYFDRLLEVGGPGYDEGFSRRKIRVQLLKI